MIIIILSSSAGGLLNLYKLSLVSKLDYENATQYITICIKFLLLMLTFCNQTWNCHKLNWKINNLENVFGGNLVIFLQLPRYALLISVNVKKLFADVDNLLCRQMNLSFFVCWLNYSFHIYTEGFMLTRNKKFKLKYWKLMKINFKQCNSIKVSIKTTFVVGQIT